MASPKAESVGSSKPVKLRAACNQCFAAKVRCSGNKPNTDRCQRCSDRNIPACTYSESRVGKVVGKRKKRTKDSCPPGLLLSSEWMLSNYPTPSVASPTGTSSLDGNTKRLCESSTRFSSMTPDEADQFHPDQSSWNQAQPFWDDENSSLGGEQPIVDTTSLPVSSLSTPQLGSPSTHVVGRISKPAIAAVSLHNTQLLTPPLLTPRYNTPEPRQAVEDPSMVCIKLLAHLKRHAAEEQQQVHILLDLVNKSVAAIRQIMMSKKARSDYGCVMLLSNILIDIVTLCESACARHLEGSAGGDWQSFTGLYNQFCNEPQTEYFSGNPPPLESRPDDREAIRMVHREANALSVDMAMLLKRKPYDGFQSVGRHENLHLELEQRLTISLGLLK